MHTLKTGWAVLLIVVLLAACGPSTPSTQDLSTEVAQALQQTAAAASPTPPPTSSPTWTVTTTATATHTPIPPTGTPEPSPTPDTRVIIGDPEDYILQASDIPGRYVLRPGGSTPHLNSEILAARPVEEAKAYLAATGRVGGWIVYYQHTSDTAIAPDWVESYVVMYKTAQGAALSMDPKWAAYVYDAIKTGELDLLEPLSDLGDQNMVYQSRERQSSGKFYVIYTIEFRYRNVWTQIEVQGMESDIQPAFVERLARTELEHLKGARLADEMP